MNNLYFLLGIPAIIFSMMGLMFLLVIRIAVRPSKEWLTTTGTIIQKEKNYSISLGKIINSEGFLSNQPDSAPTFRYEVNGIEYETTSKVRQTPGFKIDSTVDILYNPDDPQQAIINTIVQKGTIFNIIGKVLLSLGVILLLIALLIFILN